MNKKFWILIQEADNFGHFAAHVRAVSACENLISIFKDYPANTTVNICPTKKEAVATARALNDKWHRMGAYKYDFMLDGTTPAPF